MRRNLAARVVAALTLAAMLLGVAGCGGSGDNKPSGGTVPSTPGNAEGKHGPFFPQCGGISDETVTQLTRITGLVNTAKNSVGCQWLAGGGISGPHFSFSWYRGSPIGRERKTEEVSRASVDDININGHSGFIAVNSEANLGESLCEVGIQFQDDFIEWSISFAQKPFPPPCDIAKELARQSIANAK
ncbi:putative lipoprotein LprB [Mycobacterium kiyosense]|uniref:Lipoprotein LprB n=2 Tax=Mycobacteriaceae TaxID=1762 RepID=A0A9P3Q4P8_9MYCO|nr:putative lipoprotein LprB [Mycobacterium kiyosense]BDE15463.1 putative lipoprotein LprB [Mycobacterium sp. 20KCMC460]GLB81112.1 putative lipoprotein LprB [Mycobacterium kiyosense]GLB90421.1 putative lipoprotein LprB [Mycobacterium kiyosense]GLB93593.1 putative lipoprotein LprB [Mycobacterium kiyosense]